MAGDRLDAGGAERLTLPVSHPLLARVSEVYGRIRADRGRVYGPPRQNHKGIAQILAPILQPHWRAIRRGQPVPDWVVAAMLVGLKYDRMRYVFHEDNYIDMIVYLTFMFDWQGDAPAAREDDSLRIYVAGPFNADTDAAVRRNVQRAAAIGLELLHRGHLPICPHSMTLPWHRHADYEDFMRLDLDLIENYADALYFIQESPGANRERARAMELDLPIFTRLEDVPDLRSGRRRTYGQTYGLQEKKSNAGQR